MEKIIFLRRENKRKTQKIRYANGVFETREEKKNIENKIFFWLNKYRK